MDELTRISLFPLGIVLLPAVPVPLHIFEERYKELIGRCIEEDESFGLVYYTGSAIEQVGCTARVTRVAKRYEDGRLDIWVQGVRRFLIKTIYDDKPVTEADVEWIDDEDVVDEETESLASEAKEFLEGLATSVGRKFDLELLGSVDPVHLSFLLAGSDGFSPTEKQRFLEIRSTKERLRAGLESLKDILERIKLSEKIRKIIGSNGHLPDHFFS
jgi:Lon protease-like protein